jgi:chorismate dehydratase
MLRVGFTSYINAYPLHLALQNRASLVFDVPTRINRMLKDDELDVALISSFEFFQEDYLHLSPFGIGSCGPILSVNFYTKDPSQKTIHCAVTEASSTSVQLLKIVAHRYWKKELHLVPIDRKRALNDYESLLLIGNEALENQKLPGFTTIDLSHTWHNLTHTGFVFALLATKKNTFAKKKEKIMSFCQKLEESLDWSKRNWEELLTMAKNSSSHSKELLNTYLLHHRYRLAEKEMQGLHLFRKYV